MVERVEAFRQVHVHNPVTPVAADKQLRLADGVMTTASRTIPVTRWVEIRLEDRFDNTAQRLLYNPVPSRRNAPQAVTAVVLCAGQWRGDRCGPYTTRTSMGGSPARTSAR